MSQRAPGRAPPSAGARAAGSAPRRGAAPGSAAAASPAQPRWPPAPARSDSPTLVYPTLWLDHGSFWCVGCKQTSSSPRTPQLRVSGAGLSCTLPAKQSRSSRTPEHTRRCLQACSGTEWCQRRLRRATAPALSQVQTRVIYMSSGVQTPRQRGRARPLERGQLAARLDQVHVQRVQRGVADRALGLHQQLVRPQLREAGHLVLRQELPPRRAAGPPQRNNELLRRV